MANANNMIKGVVEFHDDFLGPFSSAASALIASKHIYTSASGATVARLGINGGAARITMAGDDSDAVGLFGPRAYEPDEAGLISFQVRLRTSDVDKSSIFVGLTDADTDTVVIGDEDGSLNTVASDAFGVLLEGEQDATWQTVGVGNDVDDTQSAATNIDDLTDNEWTTIRIEADNNGDAGQTVIRYKVFVDGVLMRTSLTDANGWTVSKARSSVTYCPCVSVDDRATAYTVDVAEVYVKGGVGAAFN